MKIDNFILRPEFFGGLLINRDSFEKWELTKFNTIYLIIFYNIKERETCINLVKQFFLNDNLRIDEKTLSFSKEYNYEIPKEYKIKDLGNLLNYLKTRLEKKGSINYLSSPLELSLYLTSNCQLVCDYCFMHDLIKNNSYVMPLKSAYKIIDMFVNKGIESISLLGGEPLLYDNIIDICNYINKRRVHFTITTNGLLVNYDLLKELKKFKYLKLVFSLQTLKDSKYDNKKDNINLLCKKIILAKKLGINIGVNTVLINQEYDEIKEIAKFCIRNKVDRYSLAIYVKDKKSSQPTLKIEECLKYYFELQEYINNRNSNLDFAIEGCMLYSAIYTEEEFNMGEFQKINYGCQAAQTNLDIMFDGKAYACSLIRKDNCYVDNVFDLDYDSIWHNKVFKSFREYEVSNEFCDNCNYKIFCNGGCFRNKLLKNGKFSKDIDRNCYRLVG